MYQAQFGMTPPMTFKGIALIQTLVPNHWLART